MRTIQPTENYIFAKAVTQDAVSSSGILLSTKQEKKTAEVINIGEEVKLIKPKDEIYYIPTPHTQGIKLDGNDFLLIHKDNVIGIVKDNE